MELQLKAVELKCLSWTRLSRKAATLQCLNEKNICCSVMQIISSFSCKKLQHDISKELIIPPKVCLHRSKAQPSKSACGLILEKRSVGSELQRDTERFWDERGFVQGGGGGGGGVREGGREAFERAMRWNRVFTPWHRCQTSSLLSWKHRLLELRHQCSK